MSRACHRPATFAKAYGLRPGIGLSAAQMAQLTSDIVWLVEQTVTLADGSTQRVLVPQVYVRVKPGDIDGGGALLSANALHITSAPGTGNVTNTGTLAGRTLVSITADSIDNLGGRIAGASVGINARNDLNNIGGSIEAQNAAVLTAGHDINIRTTTSSQTGAQGSRTGIDRVAGVYVTNPGGTLIASAGNDVNLVGAILSSAGTVAVGAGRDINLGTVTTARSEDATWDAKNYRRSSESQDVGSHIAGGDVTLLAGNDVKRGERRQRDHHERCRAACKDGPERDANDRGSEPRHGECPKLGATAGRGGDAEGGASATDH